MVNSNFLVSKTRTLRSFIFPLFLSSLILSHSLLAFSPANAADEQDLLFIQPRNEHRCPPSAEGDFRTALSNAIVGSTPQEQWAGCHGQTQPVMYSFEVDELGHFSHIRTEFRSGLLDRDFWTLYGISSCPPVKPFPGLVPPAHACVGNGCTRTVSTIEGEENRLALLHAIPRNIDDKVIYFTLIPASVITAFPGTFTIKEICESNNIVGIPVSAVEELWRPDPPGTVTFGSIPTADFLAEWQNFYRINPKPSKGEIITFAESLKHKYENLLSRLPALRPHQ